FLGTLDLVQGTRAHPVRERVVRGGTPFRGRGRPAKVEEVRQDASSRRRHPSEQTSTGSPSRRPLTARRPSNQAPQIGSRAISPARGAEGAAPRPRRQSEKEIRSARRT